MSKNLSQIKAEFIELCEAHQEIRNVKYGDLLDIIKSDEIEYNACFFNIAQFTPMMASKKVSYAFDIFVADKSFKDQSNRDSIENTCKDILMDLMNVIFYSDRWQEYGDFSVLTPARKYYDRTLDFVTGWRITLNFETLIDIGLCDLPFENYNYE